MTHQTPAVRETPSEPRAASVLWLPAHLLTTMTRNADAHAPNETGGVLLGYWASAAATQSGGVDAVVTAVVGPGPRAEHRPFTFAPDYDYQEQEIARVYEESGRRWQYLGDWHTHPEGGPWLSDKDLATLTRIAEAPAARATSPVMLVLVGGAPWAPHAWIGSRPRTRVRRWWRPSVSAVPLGVTVFSASD